MKTELFAPHEKELVLRVVDPYFKEYNKLLKKKEYQEIIKIINNMFSKNLNFDYFDKILLFHKAYVSGLLSDYKTSIKCYETYLKRFDDENKDSYSESLASAYFYNKNYDKAIKINKKLVKKGYEVSDKLENILFCYNLLDQYQEAYDYIQENFKLDTILSDRYIAINYASILQGLGRYEEAIKIYLKNKSVSGTYEQLGECYYELGKYELSLKYLIKEMKKDKKYRDIYYKISILYEKLGDKRKAEKYMKKYNSMEDDGFDLSPHTHTG